MKGADNVFALFCLSYFTLGILITAYINEG